jgi:hypothetical protein
MEGKMDKGKSPEGAGEKKEWKTPRIDSLKIEDAESPNSSPGGDSSNSTS